MARDQGFCNPGRHLEALENICAEIMNIDENGNVEIVLSEDNKFILQNFRVRGRRKWLRRLKDEAA